MVRVNRKLAIFLRSHKISKVDFMSTVNEKRPHGFCNWHKNYWIIWIMYLFLWYQGTNIYLTYYCCSFVSTSMNCFFLRTIFIDTYLLLPSDSTFKPPHQCGFYSVILVSVWSVLGYLTPIISSIVFESGQSELNPWPDDQWIYSNATPASARSILRDPSWEALDRTPLHMVLYARPWFDLGHIKIKLIFAVNSTQSNRRLFVKR